MTLQPLTKTQYDMLLFLEQQFNKNGTIPTYQQATSPPFNINITQPEWEKAFNNPLFQSQLISRGVPEYIITPNKAADPFRG